MRKRLKSRRYCVFIVAFGLAYATLAEAGPKPSGALLIKDAQAYLGAPYVWGGTGINGFDCSGFVGAVYKKNGYILPRVSRQQVHVGLIVRRDALSTGDLLFFSESPGTPTITHVAMAIDGHRFIHAALGRGRVCYDSLDEHYYAERLVAARRVLALPPGAYATAIKTAGEGTEPKDVRALEALLDLRRELKNPYQPLPTPGVQAIAAAADALPDDMVHEHTHGHLPLQLMRQRAQQEALQGSSDAFAPSPLRREESSLALRLAAASLSEEDAGLAQLEARYFGHDNALRVELAFVAAWPWHTHHLARPLPWYGTFDDVRQWGRLVRGLSLGQPGAKVWLQAERNLGLNLSTGISMRHFVAGAAQPQLLSLGLVATPLSLALNFNVSTLKLDFVLDDVLAPAVMGFAFDAAPWAALSPGLGRRLRLLGSWAADLRAPWQDTTTTQVHAAEVALQGTVLERHAQSLRTYVATSALHALASDRQAAWGGVVGSTFAWRSQDERGQTNVLGHALVVRLEGRLGQAGWLPSYFDMAYAQTRKTAFFRPARAAFGALGGLTKAQSLDALARQPAHASGLVELQYRYASRFELGAAYEDGKSIHPESQQIGAIDRSLMSYAGLFGLPLGPGGRGLYVRALYRLSQADGLADASFWVSARSWAQLTARLDLQDWLEVALEANKPLGTAGIAHGATQFAGGVAVHWAF